MLKIRRELIKYTKEYLKKENISFDYRLKKEEGYSYFCFYLEDIEISGNIIFYQDSSWFEIEREQFDIIKDNVKFDDMFKDKLHYLVYLIRKHSELKKEIHNVFKKNILPRQMKIENILNIV